jgi:hypothetical protein
MSAFERHTFIARDPVDIFAFTLDPANATTVLPSVVRFEKLTEGPVRQGTQFRETRRMHGKDETTEIEVSDFRPPHAYAMRSASFGITVTYRYSFTPRTGGTDVHLRCDIEASGIKRLVKPLLARLLQKEDGAQLERIKHALES